jgi:hypothetical protein
MIYFRLDIQIDDNGEDQISIRGESFKDCVEKASTIMSHHFIPSRFYLFYMGENNSTHFCFGVKCFSAEDFSKFVINTGVSDILLKERLY